MSYPITPEVEAISRLHIEGNVIPHTWDVTTLSRLEPLSRVNLEIDMLARYLARWRETA